MTSVASFQQKCWQFFAWFTVWQWLAVCGLVALVLWRKVEAGTIAYMYQDWQYFAILIGWWLLSILVFLVINNPAGSAVKAVKALQGWGWEVAALIINLVMLAFWITMTFGLFDDFSIERLWQPSRLKTELPFLIFFSTALMGIPAMVAGFVGWPAHRQKINAQKQAWVNDIGRPLDHE